MHLPSGHSATGFAAAVLCAILQACGGSGAPARTAAPTSVPTIAQAATMTPETAAPTPPADAAPTELQGRWNVHLGLGDDATLTIRETTYQIKHGGHLGAGNVSVDGNVITFKESSICPDGVGTYLWAINNGTLTFTPTGTPDPCGRTLELVGTTFTRAAG